MEKNVKAREYNFELLRIIACIAVISIHVSSKYLNASVSDVWLGTQYTEHIFASSMYNALARFAVPCFIMLSGTFTLDNSKNADCKYYYGKVVRNTGIHVVVFSILYTIYNILWRLAAVILKRKSLTSILGVIKNTVFGKPGYHMWYLYMMIGIFLMVPFLIRFKERMYGGVWGGGKF